MEDTEAVQKREEQYLEQEYKKAENKNEEILKAIEEIQKEFGVTIEEIEEILSYQVKLSHIRITRACKIYLEDFDNKEVMMDPLTKTVFLLFLKHPEGITYKCIGDYKEEITAIYGRISHSSDRSAIRKSIVSLCNPILSNSLNEKVSRVKRAFKAVVDDRIAKHYYIDGPAGGIHRIALDRSLVIWE